MEGVQVTAALGVAAAAAPVGQQAPQPAGLYVGGPTRAQHADQSSAAANSNPAALADPPPLAAGNALAGVGAGAGPGAGGAAPGAGVGIPGMPQNSAALSSNPAEAVPVAGAAAAAAAAAAPAPYGSPPAAVAAAAAAAAAAPAVAGAPPAQQRQIVPDEPYIINHTYVDYAAIPPSIVLKDYQEPTNTGGISQPFPQRLHALLSTPALYDSRVVGWQEHGRCFVIYQPKEFARTTMVTHFKHRQFTSFQRQLNLYGFKRLTRGPDKGAYYHELFLRGRPYLCLKMKRMKNKGVGKKPLPDPDNEPDFYSMPFVGVPGETTNDPHGVLPPGFDEVDSLLEKIRGGANATAVATAMTKMPPPPSTTMAHGTTAPHHHMMLQPTIPGAGGHIPGPAAAGGQLPNPEALKAGMAKYQAAAASLAAANAGVRQLPAQLQQQPTPMELQLQQQMRLQQMQMQQMQTQLNQYQQMHQLQMSQLQMQANGNGNGNGNANGSVATGGAASFMGGYPGTFGGVGGGAAGAGGFPTANPAASMAGYGGLPGAAGGASAPFSAGMAAGAPGSLLPPDLARMGSGSALLSPTNLARMGSGSAQFFSPAGLQSAGVPPTTLARMGSGVAAAAAASGASLLSPDLIRMSSGMGAATPTLSVGAGSAAPASSLTNATLQVQAQQSQLQQLQAERARLEQQMIVTTAAADRARAEADAAVVAAQQPQPQAQGQAQQALQSKGQSADLLWNRLNYEQIATVQASAAQPTATAVAVNTTATAPVGAVAKVAVPSPAKLKAGVSDSTEASPLDDGLPTDGDIVNAPVMHDLLAKQQALLLRELEQEKKNLEQEKRAKAASAVNKAKAAAAALGISFGKADDAAAAVTDTAAINGVGQTLQQQGPPISSISIPQVPTNQQVPEASQQVAAAAAAVEALNTTCTVPAAIASPATEAFPTGRTGAAAQAPVAQPPAAERTAKGSSTAPAIPPPPTYEQAMDMKEDTMIAQQQAKEQLAAVSAGAAAPDQDADMDSIHSQMGSIGISAAKNEGEGGATAEIENLDQVKRKRAIRFRRSSNTNSSVSGKSRDESAAEGSAVSAGPKKKKGRMVRLLNFAKGKGTPGSNTGASTNGVVNTADAIGATAATAAEEEEDPVELEEMQGDMMTESVDIDTIFSSKKSGESVAERAILESKN